MKPFAVVRSLEGGHGSRVIPLCALSIVPATACCFILHIQWHWCYSFPYCGRLDLCHAPYTLLCPLQCALWGLGLCGVGGLCVGGARHGRVWVTDAGRLYQPRAIPSQPLGQPHGLTRCQPAVSTSRIYGANSPPIRSRIFSRRGLKQAPLIW